MPTIRPNLTRSALTLDEQSFEGLLSAAFTIQEHNERRKRAQQATEPEATVEPEVPSEPESSANASSTCPHCGAPKMEEAARCGNCGQDEFRPGERLQRNWASMWLKSQEQGLWPERSSETGETIRKIGESTQPDLAPLESQSTSQVQMQSAFIPTMLGHSANEQIVDGHSVDEQSVGGQSVPGESVESANWNAAASEIDLRGSRALEMIENHGERGLSPVESASDEDYYPLEITADAQTDGGGGTARSSMLQRFADIQVKLRFHRADLYLGVAVFVALLALLWPAASAPRRSALSPWERALVTMGIAEAPAPVIHLQGDPSIEVWVDPHTALYYCPGAESFGKTADGRISTQREAQMDRFEAAGRSVCE